MDNVTNKTRLPAFSIAYSVVKTVTLAIGKALLDMTIIWPVIRLIGDLQFGRYSTSIVSMIEKHQQLSPLLKQRVEEMEQRVNALAKRMGIVSKNPFVVTPENPFSSQGAHSHSNLFIPVQVLLKHEDLPEDLRLVQQLIESSPKSASWMNSIATKMAMVGSFLGFRKELVVVTPTAPPELDRPCEQWQADTRKWIVSHLSSEIEKAKIPSSLNLWEYRQRLRLEIDNPSMLRRMDNAVIGHELAHCVLNHHNRKDWTKFAWRLLALPTLGISTLFEERVMQYVSRKHEKEADLFSAMQLGPEGLIDTLTLSGQIPRLLYQKAPDEPIVKRLWDAEGNSRLDRDHPPLSKRIAYLQKLLV